MNRNTYESPPREWDGEQAREAAIEAHRDEILNGGEHWQEIAEQMASHPTLHEAMQAIAGPFNRVFRMPNEQLIYDAMREAAWIVAEQELDNN